MKKNGFTLIEILGVIVLLSVLSVIVLVSVNKSLKDSRVTLDFVQLDNIRNAAAMWRTDNIESISDDGYYIIFLSTLQNAGYIDNDIFDLSTDSLYNEDMVIKVSLNDILIGDEIDYVSVDDYILSLVNSEINILNEKLIGNMLIDDGVYYFDSNGDLEKNGDIIPVDSNGAIRGNILIHNHQFISGCINYGSYNYDYYKGTISEQNYSCSTVRGENLVLNGDLSYHDTTNFSGSLTYNNEGYISRTSSSNSTINTKNYIPVNIEKTYEFGLTARCNNQDSTKYSGFLSYDIDKKNIGSANVMYISNTLTTLAQDLKDGDEYVYLTDMTNWNKTTTAKYQRGFIFWNYVDSTGYQYPELTYSRNVWSNLYTNDNIDLANNRIKLTNPWNYGSFEAGTKLSQSNSGSTNNYNLKANTTMPNNFTEYSSIVSGISPNTTTKFRYGTKYIRWFMWDNYNAQLNVTTDFKDIYIREITN